jgi:hypothetical protein
VVSWQPYRRCNGFIGIRERCHGNSVTAVMMRSSSEISFSWKQATCPRALREAKFRRGYRLDKLSIAAKQLPLTCAQYSRLCVCSKQGPDSCFLCYIISTKLVLTNIAARNSKTEAAEGRSNMAAASREQEKSASWASFKRMTVLAEIVFLRLVTSPHEELCGFR